MSGGSPAAANRQQAQLDAAAYRPAKPFKNELPEAQSRKRKITDFEQPFDPFNFELCPNSTDAGSITVRPLYKIPRSCLSLSNFDLGWQPPSRPHPPFFASYIAVLEDETTGLDGSPKVLIAQSTSDQRLYAIEQARPGLYAFCRLASWVDQDHLKSQASTSPRRFALQTIGRTGSEETWWGGIALSVGQEDGRQIVKRQKIAANAPTEDSRESIIPPNIGHSEFSATSLADLDETIASTQRVPGTSVQDTSQTFTAVATRIVDHAVIEQYLDTLYLSGASLAYYVKGPLSRARALHSEQQSLPSLAELLRDNVLTVQSMNKRYTDYLPSTIRDSTSLLDGGPDNEPATSRKKPRRRGFKRRKDGSLPGEEDVLVRWWTSEDASATAATDAETTIRDRLAPLRFRETLLQLVVILEALTVEKICSELPQVDRPIEVPSQAPHDVAESQVDAKKIKSKKPKDIASLAETLVDRLTIWQSIEITGSKAAEKRSQAPSQGSVDQPLTENSDKLKDFCLDTMIPFYDSRLPELVGQLSEKMGLPSMSPLRRKRGATESVSKLAPGTAISRRAPPMVSSRSRFSRVASDTMTKSVARPPSLMRSATDTNIFNRERSSTPESAFMDAVMSRPPSRQSVSREDNESHFKRKRSLSRANSVTLPNKSFTQREVDLSAMTKFNEARARKKADVQEELKTAIAILKKPNRGLAAKEVMAEAEARHTKQHRPSNFAQRRGLTGVQVDVTPKRAQKRRDTFVTSDGELTGETRTYEPETIPSTMPSIPASVIRTTARSSTKSPGYSTNIASTPSRSGGRDAEISETPLNPRQAYSKPSRLQPPNIAAHPFATPTKPGKPVPHTSQAPSTPNFALCSTPASIRNMSSKIAATPLQASEWKENVSMLAPAKPRSQPAQPPEPSIYDSLGWDD